MRPLDGITVITIEHAIAAPFCTRQLADLGARVIKVERRGEGDFARRYDERVDGLSSHFVWTNRSKESLALDLKDAGDFRVLRRLLEKADVFVQNLAPGAAARMGLSYEQLSPELPRLIVCDISGYGADGPYRDKKAYDLLIQSEAGFLSVTGTPDDMAKAGNSIADIAAGMYAYANILAALMMRRESGRGTLVEISMLESMVEWMGYPMYYAYQGQNPPPRVGASHATIYPYGPFSTAEGEVMLGIQNEREWALFCADVLEMPDLVTDERFARNSGRAANRASLRDIINAVFGQLSREEVLARLEAAKIANAAVSDMAALWAHPQLRARGRWRDIETPAGPVPVLLPPGLPQGVTPRMDAVPALGQHNAAILRELGMEEETDNVEP